MTPVKMLQCMGSENVGSELETMSLKSSINVAKGSMPLQSNTCFPETLAI